MKRFAAARASYDEAVGIYRAHQQTPPLDLANALRSLALLKEAVGEDAKASALWEEAGILYAEANVEAGIVESARRVAKLEKRNGTK
ncbi:MAG TPA: hypothetical protein VGR76_11160 [Candidatus Angelobacter sp.]|nr:hypothetical protein [Candidatus Angelobacter sp.]